MKREIVTLRGFDDAGLGGRVRKGMTFEVSQQFGDELVRNGLVRFTSEALTPPPPLGNESAAGTAAPSSASPAVPVSPPTTVSVSVSGAKPAPKKAAPKPRAKKPPADE
jgi:hypothetical protein